MTVPVRTGAPTMLMYHSVAHERDDPYRITVAPDRFARQMRWLARRGLRGVSVRDLLTAAATGDGRRLVGLTFDDGYADFVTNALPVLSRLGFGATLFVVAGKLGGYNDWEADGPRKPLMSAGDVRDVARQGIEIGSHTMRHPHLPWTDGEELRYEVAASRAVLGDLVSAPVVGFCYPYGDLSAEAEAAVADAGYGYACATWSAARLDRYALPRTYVGQRDGPLRLTVKLARHGLTWRR
ncbi:MAG TPA: polysaccharide deacetylase family protein [Micromonosporaceae bacterium]